MRVCWISLGSMLLALLAGWMDGRDMTETHTWRWIYRNYHQLRLFKLFGMARLCLLEDLQMKRSSNRISILYRQCLIKAHRLCWHLRVRVVFWCVLLCVLIWGVFLFHIWVIIMGGCVFVMVQCMISLVGLGKGLLFKIYRILTTPFMRMVRWFVLRH